MGPCRGWMKFPLSRPVSVSSKTAGRDFLEHPFPLWSLAMRRSRLVPCHPTARTDIGMVRSRPEPRASGADKLRRLNHGRKGET